ncbi:ribonuclease HII [uncultured Sunxiuqinia sp.]|uniref:ribonuclease HII n=1 Tax=uncultured Sunxiuqinia sp. TaxID=1573825 RepID=UPI0030D8CB90|tara:strand:- start:1384 stop:2025 length:642 start_codon:yes stop_codon:yes gene_type:complete
MRKLKKARTPIRKAILQGCLMEGRTEAGCDEAGRGCLAGPVFAAAVILPAGFENDLLNDSKKLSEKQRDQLRPLIEEQALAFGVGVVSNQEVDQINVLNASFLAMHRAVEQLSLKPEHLLIDGNRFRPYPEIAHDCIIKGDGKFLSIAAASVLAKTYRDDYMNRLHEEFPEYQWLKNKGYPTKAHREAIRKLGPTPYHRLSFRLLEEQLKLDL